MTSTLLAAYRSLRKRGVRQFSQVVYKRASLNLGLYLRRGRKVAWLDGCRFEMAGMPNTEMKLELLTGGYEKPERDAARRYIPRELPVVELGGCIGVVACITNKLLKTPVAHVVLEANPLVIPHLLSNRDANDCSFKIINRAIAYDHAEVTFTPHTNFWGNSLYHKADDELLVTVPATQLRSILEEEGFKSFVLICDIEGHEYELVMREAEAIRAARLIIMEVHPHVIGKEKVQLLLAKLAALGFETVERSALVVVLSKAS